MKKLTIPLFGISRNTDDSISKDGQCMELINARVKNGSIEPVGQPILEKAFISGKTPIFIHKNGVYEHIITYDDKNNLTYDSERADGVYTNKNILIKNIPNVSQLQSIGNTLIIQTDSSIHYSIFTNQSYKYLGEKPPFPTINFTLDIQGSSSERTYCGLAEDIRVNPSSYNAFSDANTSIVTNTMNGIVSKVVSKAKEEGYFVNPVFVRYALRMYDGSYISHSAPILLLTHRKYTAFTNIKQHLTNADLSDIKWKDGKITGFYFYTIVDKQKLQYQSFQTLLKDWKDIITCIDVFVSKQIQTVNLDAKIEGFQAGNQDGHDPQITLELNFLGEDKIKENIITSSIFYKLHSFNIDENIPGGHIFKDGLLENMEQNEALSDDAFTHNVITGRSYVYNARLHLFSIKETLFNGYPLNLFNNYYPALWGEGSTELPDLSATGTCQVYINTDSGEKIVFSSFSMKNRGIIPYICYPDSRANKMVIRLTSSGRNYQKTFILKAHSFLNLAYHLDKLTAIKLSDFTESVSASEENNNTVHIPNKIKVSEINNPFYFPAKQTYTVSNREIIGLATATTALSTGQFGQFPLYVFTEEGIFALSTGTDVVYLNSYPVSRDCCNNPNSIVSTDKAVVFSSSSGLMLLSGSNVEKISGNIEGYLPSSINSSPIFTKIARIAGYQNILSSTEFVYFLDGAKIGYNYEEKEIIVSNTSYGYTYVYNLGTSEWHKMNTPVKAFINSYPECFAILSDDGMYNIHNKHRTINKILLISRPLKFGSITHKRILQSGLRGIIKPSLSDVYFRGEPVQFREEGVHIFSEAGFYILGSNDAEHFTLLSGVEKIEDIRDLITKMNKTKAYKYFVFCLVGGVRTDVAINYIEVMVDETYTNRLR